MPQTSLVLMKKQHEFVLDKTRHIAFVAGIGSGKSFALCVKGMLKAMSCPGSVGMITGPYYPMLRDATLKTFLDVVPQEAIAYIRHSPNIDIGLHCPDGSVSEVLFRSTSDPDSLRGPNLLWVGMDEAAMSSEEAFKIIQGRIRAKPDDDQQIFLATTPKGLNWIYERFAPHKAKSDYALYTTETKENIYLGEEYLRALYESYGDGAFAQQELHGKFVPYEGLVYGDVFKPDIHVTNIPFDSSLPVDLWWDFGYPNATAVGAIQQTGEGSVHIIDESYRYKTLDEDIVAELRARPWFQNIQDVICDEARPDSILRLQRLGLPARPSSKGRIADGITKVRSLFNIDKDSGKPLLLIDKRCEMFIDELNRYRWRDKAPSESDWPEAPVDAYNHHMDGLRYWTLAKWFPRPNAAVLNTAKKPKKRVMRYQLIGSRRFR